MIAYYWSPPTAAELARWSGAKKLEDFPEPEVDVWEENWDVLRLFCDFSDQWRMGPSGPYALDMNVFNYEMEQRGVVGEERQEWLSKLRVIARQALHEITNPA